MLSSDSLSAMMPGGQVFLVAGLHGTPVIAVLTAQGGGLLYLCIRLARYFHICSVLSQTGNQFCVYCPVPNMRIKSKLINPPLARLHEQVVNDTYN